MTDDRLSADEPPEAGDRDRAAPDLARLSKSARAVLDVLAVLGPQGVPKAALREQMSVHRYVFASPGRPRSALGKVAHVAIILKGEAEVDAALRRLAKKGAVLDARTATVRASGPARRAALSDLSEEALTRAVVAAADTVDVCWTLGLEDVDAPEDPELDPPMRVRAEGLLEIGFEALVEADHDLLDTYGYRLRHSTEHTVDDELDHWRRLVAEYERVHGPGRLSVALWELGRVLHRQNGDHAQEVVELYDDFTTDARRAHGPAAASTLAGRAARAEALTRAGRAQEAVADMESALAEAEGELGAFSAGTTHLHLALAAARRGTGGNEEAERRLDETLQAYEAQSGGDPHETLDARLTFAHGLEEADRTDAAAEALREVLADCRARLRFYDLRRWALISRAKSQLATLETDIAGAE
ncbi:hypothetical protein LP52_19955 [Streptomonospora alba]|uniref:MalT-like TPR region domain-containing protein n=1 Tax=Streptomonospora alba TaxID=183763 RepID=A0A0C2JK12_9ACTN|nr:hypothetical protein [Streptomonospora alba]KIH97252.1 hypothetical protein LP52_19955 [Streptomonospora alba]